MTAYFDNAATTFPKPECVYRAMDTFNRECGVNVGRGQYRLASRAADLVEETRELLLDLNHCPAKQVVFMPSATTALNVILRGIGISDGWNVYVSPFEHNAVMRVLHHIGKTIRINLHVLAFDKIAFTYDLPGIHEQFAQQKPHVVVVSHASNVCGVVAPIHAICAASKKYGAVNVIDMAQTMGLVDTDLSVETIDYTVFAGHKTLYGPLGIGGFICKADARPKPLVYGGTGVDSANPDLPDTLPERYEIGSLNIAAVAGLNAALKWWRDTGAAAVRTRESSNHARLLDVLVCFRNVRVVLGGSIGVVSCVFEDYTPDEIGRILAERDIAVRTGLHCAPDAHRSLGTFPVGTVRLSVGAFNTDADFVMLEAALEVIEEEACLY